MSEITDPAAKTLAEPAPTVKVCKKCGIEKSIRDFTRIRKAGVRRRSWCKACVTAYKRIYQSLPETKRLQQGYRKKYRARPEAKEPHRADMRRRRGTNPAFRLASNLRTRVWSVLKGRSKSARTLELLGCTIKYLTAHLESQFKDGMSWDNYGKWHVDHIRPCASFDLTTEEGQKKCFHFTNLQPLWAIDNFRKSYSRLSTISAPPDTALPIG